MSISEKQMAANRANAQKSTGPKTDEGKALASRNATRHGLYSRDVILKSPHIKENPEEYDRLLQSLKDELRPASHLQDFLVCKIANCLWRCRRAALAETAQVNRQLTNAAKEFPAQSAPDLPSLHDPNLSPEQNNDLTIMVGTKLIPHEEFSANVLRYEMRLDRQLERVCNLFFRLRQYNCDAYEKGLAKQNTPGPDILPCRVPRVAPPHFEKPDISPPPRTETKPQIQKVAKRTHLSSPVGRGSEKFASANFEKPDIFLTMHENKMLREKPLFLLPPHLRGDQGGSLTV